MDRTIVIPPGAYDLDEIAEYVQKWIRNKGDGNPFVIGGNTNTLKTYIDVTSDNCVVKIGDSSIKSVLGWNTGNLRKGTHVSEKKLTITDINHIFVHCNVIRGEYVNLRGDGNISRQTVLSSFYPLVSPRYRIIKEPRLYYKQTNTIEIKDVVVWLTDQNNNPIDNGDEDIFISLHVIPYWDKRAYNKKRYETRI